jgi:hypothetical protein
MAPAVGSRLRAASFTGVPVVQLRAAGCEGVSVGGDAVNRVTAQAQLRESLVGGDCQVGYIAEWLGLCSVVPLAA